MDAISMIIIMDDGEVGSDDPDELMKLGEIIKELNYDEP